MEQDHTEEIICTRPQRRKQGPKLVMSGSKVNTWPGAMCSNPLIQEDLTCGGATKPVCHHYRAGL